jgi:hypothetical protein
MENLRYDSPACQHWSTSRPNPRYVQTSSELFFSWLILGACSSIDDQLFTLHELSSTLTLQNIPATPKFNVSVPLIANVSIIPSENAPGASWAGAEIILPQLTKKFPTQYVYASNRNVGNQTSLGDPIAIFEVVKDYNGKAQGFKLVKEVFTGLDQIRGMMIGNVDDGSDEFIVAGGVAGSAGVVVYQRVAGGKDLKEVARNTDIPTRTSFIWI